MPKGLDPGPLPDLPRSAPIPGPGLQACSPHPGTSSVSLLTAWAHGWLQGRLDFSLLWKK